VKNGSDVTYRDRVPRVLSYHGENARMRETIATAQQAIERELQKPPIGAMTEWTLPSDLSSLTGTTT